MTLPITSERVGIRRTAAQAVEDIMEALVIVARARAAEEPKAPDQRWGWDRRNEELMSSLQAGIAALTAMQPDTVVVLAAETGPRWPVGMTPEQRLRAKVNSI